MKYEEKKNTRVAQSTDGATTQKPLISDMIVALSQNLVKILKIEGSLTCLQVIKACVFKKPEKASDKVVHFLTAVLEREVLNRKLIYQHYPREIIEKLVITMANQEGLIDLYKEKTENLITKILNDPELEIDSVKEAEILCKIKNGLVASGQTLSFMIDDGIADEAAKYLSGPDASCTPENVLASLEELLILPFMKELTMRLQFLQKKYLQEWKVPESDRVSLAIHLLEGAFGAPLFMPIPKNDNKVTATPAVIVRSLGLAVTPIKSIRLVVSVTPQYLNAKKKKAYVKTAEDEKDTNILGVRASELSPDILRSDEMLELSRKPGGCCALM